VGRVRREIGAGRCEARWPAVSPRLLPVNSNRFLNMKGSIEFAAKTAFGGPIAKHIRYPAESRFYGSIERIAYSGHKSLGSARESQQIELSANRGAGWPNLWRVREQNWDQVMTCRTL
jgi:hypothetical protein